MRIAQGLVRLAQQPEGLVVADGATAVRMEQLGALPEGGLEVLRRRRAVDAERVVVALGVADRGQSGALRSLPMADGTIQPRDPDATTRVDRCAAGTSGEDWPMSGALLRLWRFGRALLRGSSRPARAARRRPTVRPRDFQRARVYRWEAEHVFPLAADRLSLEQCRALVERAYRWREAPGSSAWLGAADGHGRSWPTARLRLAHGDQAPALGAHAGRRAARMRPRHGQ